MTDTDRQELTDTERDIKAVATALYAAGANPEDGVSYADLATAAIEAMDLSARRVEWEAERLAPLHALLPDECYVTQSTLRCTSMIGGTFPNGGVWAEEMCCLPCRLRAALAVDNTHNPTEAAVCGSCGEPAPYTITLRGEPVPACLRHLNHWRTPAFDYTCPTVCVEQNHPGREHLDWLGAPASSDRAATGDET